MTMQGTVDTYLANLPAGGSLNAHAHAMTHKPLGESKRFESIGCLGATGVSYTQWTECFEAVIGELRPEFGLDILTHAKSRGANPIVLSDMQALQFPVPVPNEELMKFPRNCTVFS